jgi:formate hydrogenlyase subunit 4
MMPILFIFIASLLFPGIINLTRSFLSGRKGPGLFQPIRDILRLFKKGSVISNTTSLVFKMAPAVQLATIITSLLIVPLGERPGFFSFSYDFVFFFYLLALGKFFGIIAALDTGSSFEGMGASREAHLSMLAEPAVFALLGSLSLFTGKTSFHEIYISLAAGPAVHIGIAVMAAFVLFLFMIIESSRVPVDDPRTHLELTMIHEVMILDNSGFDLGLILYTNALRFALFGALIANLFIGGLSLWISAVVFIAIEILLAVMVGFVESIMARFRMNHNPQFVLSLSSIALLIFIGILLILQSN